MAGGKRSSTSTTPNKKKPSKKASKKSKQATKDDNTKREVVESETSNIVGVPVPREDRDKPTTPPQKARFEEFLRDALAKGVNGILEEYHNFLRPYVPAGIQRRAFDANPNLNRYTDVICVDATRVQLKNHPRDYIHANYVRGEPLLNAFVCTQGPMMDTIKDFWKMVAQEKIGNIIMLCDIVEQGKEKCQQYWPREEGCCVEWPGISVRNVKVDNSDPATIVSTLECTFNKKDKTTLQHHHWRTWPDKSVPQSVTAPFRLLRAVRHSSRATVVHCSAGIGRTGTIVALELCLQTLLSEKKLVILDTVKSLRQQRMHSVQTDLQYLYLFKCMLSLTQKFRLVPPDCVVKLDMFDKEYQALIDAKLAKDKPEAYAPLMPLTMKAKEKDKESTAPALDVTSMPSQPAILSPAPTQMLPPS